MPADGLHLLLNSARRPTEEALCAVPTLAQRIVTMLKANGPMEDGQLAAALGVQHQAVNQACRTLGRQGVLKRHKSVGSSIRNALVDGPAVPSVPQPIATPTAQGLISEDEVKVAVRDHLKEQGYTITVAWGHQPGIDIDARRDRERRIIEAKGEVALAPQQNNYFVGALGELVQRICDPSARYGLALPGQQAVPGLGEETPGLGP